MRILFFIDCFVAGGKERRLTELMKALKARHDIGLEFELAVMDTEIHYKEIFDLGIKIHYLVRKTKKDISIFGKLYRLCKTFKPDIIHCWDSMTAVYSVPICRLLKIKLVNGMVVTTPVTTISSKIWLRGRLTFPFSNIIVGNSLAGLRGFNAPSKKSICIYNGFNFERLTRLEDPGVIKSKFNIQSALVILMIASFENQKDYESYIEAAKILCTKRNDIEFIAVGNGKNFTDISEKAGVFLNNKIKLVGSQSNVESIINVSDVCVLMTNSKLGCEGISNSVLEYMAMGKPVVASSGGGTNEIIEDKETGFIVSPSSARELSEKIEMLADDIDLRTKMGEAGRRRIEDRFSINKMVDKFIEVYKNFAVNSVKPTEAITSK